jgi:hypothetical protein
MDEPEPLIDPDMLLHVICLTLIVWAALASTVLIIYT